MKLDCEDAMRSSALSQCVLLSTTAFAQADDWMLRVELSGRVCHVQLKTASKLGEDFKGPFASRKAACVEAGKQYDPDLSDKSKCWTYGGGTVSGCKTDGVTLPPSSATKNK